MVAATGTRPLTVNANVVGNCQVNNLTINFGNYDPLVSNAATPLAQQSALSIKCTKGVQATSIDLNTGSPVVVFAENNIGYRIPTV